MNTVSSFVSRLTINLVVAAVAVGAPLLAVSQTVAVRFGQLVTGKGAVIQDAVVLIEKDPGHRGWIGRKGGPPRTLV